METDESPKRSSLTLRLLCGNAVGMVAFVLAFLAAGSPSAAIAAGVIVGILGFVGSKVLIEAYDL